MVRCCYDYKPKLYVMHFLYFCSAKMTCFYKSFPIPYSEFRTGKTQLSHTLCGKAKMDPAEMLNVEFKSF